MFKFLLLFLWAILPTIALAQNVQNLFQDAQKAYQAKEYARFLVIYQTLDSLRPMHPTVLYNLSAGHALNNNTKKALETLEKLILINASTAIRQDSDFVSLWKNVDFKRINQKIDDLRIPIQNSQEAFRIKEKDLHLESVGYDSKTKAFYGGCVHRRKIIQIDAQGNVSDFTKEGDENIWAVLGIQVDAKNRVLWAVSSVTPEMKNYKANSKQESKVLKFDLTTQKLLAEYTLTDSKPHFFGDLILHPNGIVYISDSSTPTIYQIKPKENRITIFKETSLRSLQGLTLNKKGDKMFIADYASQLYVIDLPTQNILPVKIPATVSAKGTDGLYFFNNSLIAIQNGIEPKRVIQFKLNKTQTEIVDFKVIEANNSLFEEPTLGVLVGNIFYYVANSSWGAYKNGELQTDKLGDIVIMKTTF